MARPIKNNADYFPHKTQMRNDRKIIFLRQKYGQAGYSIYVMLLECITESDKFLLSISDKDFKLLSSDLMIEEEQLKEIINDCVYFDLFQIVDNYLTCRKLIDVYLSPLLSYREQDRIRKENKNKNSILKENNDNKEFSDKKTNTNDSFPSGKPYSKEKKSKEKESKVYIIEPEGSAQKNEEPEEPTLKRNKYAPANVETVLDYGQMILENGELGIFNLDICKEFYNYYEAQNWSTGNNKQITNWTSKLKNWISEDKKRKEQNGKQINNGNNGNNGTRKSLNQIAEYVPDYSAEAIARRIKELEQL